MAIVRLRTRRHKLVEFFHRFSSLREIFPKPIFPNSNSVWTVCQSSVINTVDTQIKCSSVLLLEKTYPIGGKVKVLRSGCKVLC